MFQILHQSHYPSTPKAEIIVVDPLKRNKSGLIWWKWLDGFVYHCTAGALPEILKISKNFGLKKQLLSLLHVRQLYFLGVYSQELNFTLAVSELFFCKIVFFINLKTILYLCIIFESFFFVCVYVWVNKLANSNGMAITLGNHILSYSKQVKDPSSSKSYRQGEKMRPVVKLLVKRQGN